jgi:hypothetical protein
MSSTDKKKQLVLDKTIRYKTFVYDFENGWVYVEKWVNNSVKETFFAEKTKVFPDGTLKLSGRKYFFSLPGEPVTRPKTMKIQCDKFKDFDFLYCVDEISGEYMDVNGKIVS